MAEGSKSIGDFYVNIIPKLDSIGLNTGISAINDALNIAQKGWGLIAGSFQNVLNIAKPIKDLKLLSDETGLSVQKISLLRNVFEQSGVSAGTADDAIIKLRSDMANMNVWGQGNWAKLGAAGLIPIIQDKNLDQFQKIIKIREHIKTLSSDMQISAKDAIGAGLGGDFSKFISQSDAQFMKSMSYAKRITPITNKDVKESEKFLHETTLAQQQLTALERTLLTSAMPIFTELIKKLNDLLTNKEFIEAMKGVASVISVIIGTSAKGAAGFVQESIIDPIKDTNKKYGQETTGGQYFDAVGTKILKSLPKIIWNSLKPDEKEFNKNFNEGIKDAAKEYRVFHGVQKVKELNPFPGTIEKKQENIENRTIQEKNISSNMASQNKTEIVISASPEFEFKTIQTVTNAIAENNTETYKRNIDDHSTAMVKP